MESAHRQIRLGASAPGESLLEQLLRRGVDVPHECGGHSACGSCIVVVREGRERLSAADDDEQDVLDKSGAVQPGSRLACRAIMVGGTLEIDIPEPQAARADLPASAAAPIVAVTERAEAYLTVQLARRGAPPIVRLLVRPAGCSGLRYEIGEAQDAGPEDAVFDSARVRIVVDRASLPYIAGTVIDLEQRGLAHRLRFDNPNARQTCGCGESFAA